MTLHWWMHWFWVTLWFTVITGIPLPSKIRDTTTTTTAIADAATRSLISEYKSDYLTTSKYQNDESVTELFKESSSSLSYVKNDDDLSVSTSAPILFVDPLPTPSSLISLASSSLRENNRVSKSISGINNHAAVSTSLPDAFEINNNKNNNNKGKEVKEEYDNRNINNNNNNNVTVLKNNNNNNNNDYRVDREAYDNSRDSTKKNSPASVLKNNFEESSIGSSAGSSLIIIPSKNQYNINISSSSNYTNDNIHSKPNNDNNNNNNRTSSLSSNRSLSLIKKKDSKVTWLLTGNKTSASSSRNEKLIITTEDDEHRRNSSLNNNNNDNNNNNNDDDDDDDNLAVLPLQEPIPTRFKLVLNRTKFIPSTNINNDDNFNDNYNDNDKLLNKSDDVEIRGDNIEDTRLLATAASILQGVSESPRLSRARSAFPGDYQQDEQQEQRQAKMSEKNGFGNNSTNSSAMDIAAVTGSCLATVVLIGTMGSLGFIMYRRRYMNPPQTLNSDKCSNPDSSGYIDDSTIRDNSEEMYSLDNDSFLNSLEAMTIQNYWTDSVKHTKL